MVWWALKADSYATPFSARPESDGQAMWPALLAVLVLGVVGTGLAQSFQYDVVRAAGPTVATTVTYLIPVVAVALGVTFMDEHLSWPQLLGAAIVLAAAVVIGSPARSRREDDGTNRSVSASKGHDETQGTPAAAGGRVARDRVR